MTRFFLIKELKAFCEKQVKNLLYPTAVQKGDTKKVERAPEVYAMRLPNSREAKKFAPYIIIQLADSLHVQNESEPAGIQRHYPLYLLLYSKKMKARAQCDFSTSWTLFKKRC